MKNRTKYFKVFRNFNDYVPITDSELHKAIHAFITGKSVILNNGAIGRVQDVVPDFHRAMGWNDGYKLGPEDHADIARNCGDYNGVIQAAKDRVVHLINTHQEELIGKPDLAAKQLDA